MVYNFQKKWYNNKNFVDERVCMMDYSQLLGNSAAKRELAKGLHHHAYLITGEPGSGKKTLAKLMAAQLVEDARGKVERGSHPDVLRLMPEEEGKQIPVKKVRAFRQEAYIKPNEAPRKVLLIEQCELLNEAGQNAILKILEEPPAYVVFILLAPNREIMLPTIRSRCTIWEMAPVGAEEGVPFLKERYPEGGDYATALRAAGGNLGRAMEYLAGGTFLSYGEMGVKFLGRLCRNKKLAAEQLLSTLPKGDFILFLDSFARLCHDFLLYKTGSHEENIVFLESVLQIKPFLGRMKLNQLYAMASLTIDSKQRLAEYGNENLIKTCFIAEMGELLN